MSSCSYPSVTDINSRMPRAEASEIFNLIKPIGYPVSLCTSLFADGIIVAALQLDPRLFIEIMGSFRRRVSPIFSPIFLPHKLRSAGESKTVETSIL